jgi:hypothetical protein
MNIKTISKDLEKYISDSIKKGISEQTGMIENYDEMLFEFFKYELVFLKRRQVEKLALINLETQSVVRIQLEAEINILEMLIEEFIEYIDNCDVSKNIKEKIKEVQNE